ncbi:MAG: HAD-IA family hydrolase [Candidatus Altiarchaeota archaeon]|nr:HAD-IA family hydrolase [Candidatus Altiarchaeota archaeon]
MNYIFDLDGTLVDTVELHGSTFIDAFKETGVSITREEVSSLIGLAGREIAKILGAENPETLYQRKVELFLSRIGEIKEMDGATKVINELKKRGHKVCIATSSGKSMADAIFEKFNWSFDTVVTAEDVSKTKPNPEMLQTIIDKFPGPSVMIGDATYDKEMADAQGIPSLILGKDIQKLEEVLVR